MDRRNFWKVKSSGVNQYNWEKFSIYNYNEEIISDGIHCDRKILDDITQKHNEAILDYVL